MVSNQDNIRIRGLCIEGNIELLDSLRSEKKPDTLYDLMIYRYAIEENNFKVLDWIYSVNNNVVSYTPDILINKCLTVKNWDSFTPQESTKYQLDIIKILNYIYKFYKDIHFDYYKLFGDLCQDGNILIAQWLYSKFRYQIKLTRLNVSYYGQIEFLTKIINSDNIVVLQWIDTLNIKFSKHAMNTLFNYICKCNKIKYINWFLNKDTYHIDDATLFAIKEQNNIELSNIFKKIYYNYYCKIVDDKIISNKFILNPNIIDVYDDLKYIIKEKTDDCMICMYKNDYNVKLDCNHMYCRECFIELDKKCPMCFRLINDKNLTLVKSE
jgi:hypothetical protein